MMMLNIKMTRIITMIATMTLMMTMLTPMMKMLTLIITMVTLVMTMMHDDNDINNDDVHDDATM